jgi:hypothetical protein
MDHHDQERLPVELAEIAQQLRDERPQASPLELDRIKLEVQSRARRPAQRRESFMRSRLVITTMLVIGVLMSGAGAGLAVSGVSGDGSAGNAQYTTTTRTVLPTTQSQAAPQQPTTQPTTQSAQAPRQVESSGNELPFTGFAAIPVLLAGIALLTAGAVMRRRTSDRHKD